MTDECVFVRFNLAQLMQTFNLRAADVAEHTTQSADTIRRWARKKTPPLRNFANSIQVDLARALTLAIRAKGHEGTITAADLTTVELNDDVVRAANPHRPPLVKPGWLTDVTVFEAFLVMWQVKNLDGSLRCEITRTLWDL